LEADVRSDNSESDEHDDGSLHGKFKLLLYLPFPSSPNHASVHTDFVSGDDSDDQSVTLALNHDFPYTRNHHRHPRDNHWQLAREEHIELSTQAQITRERHPPQLTIHPSDCSSNELPAFRKPMPGDVSLWRVRVKVSESSLLRCYWLIQHLQHGFESDCLELVLRQSRRVQNFKIVSAFSQPSIPGTIYVEAPAMVDIRRAFRNVHTVFLNEEIMLVPISERVQLLEMRNTDVVAFGHWVRIKKGAYKKDLGFVTDMDSFTSRVRLWVIPRLSYSDIKRTRYTRSDQSLFDPDRARTVFGPDTVQQRIDRFKFQGKVFKHGLLERVLALNDLTTKNVHPTYDELRLFSESLGFDKALKHRWNTDYAAATLCINDRVRVISGEQKGFLGTIVDKHENTVQVQLRKEPDARITFEDEPLLDLLACQVSKSFKVGDYVEVRDGFWAGSRGYVLGICDSVLKVLSDHSWSSYSEVCDVIYPAMAA
jgi:Early transcription elongation factor of RNA pol II, NGN section